MYEQDAGGNVTRLLQRWTEGDEAARDRLFAFVYPQLHKLAGHLRDRHGGEPALEVTELVNEVFLKLAVQTRTKWKNRAQFFAVAGHALRRILVDSQRHRLRAKRGGGAAAVPLDEVTLAVEGHGVDGLDLDRALEQLKEVDGTAARVVELRYLAGLSHSETAAALGIGRASVGRCWRFARAWLRARLGDATMPHIELS